MIRFNAIYKTVPWGARRLQTHFSRQLPDGPVGEAWELVDLEGNASIALSGPFAGKTLSQLWRQEVLGGSGKGPFPFLLKWLDTNEFLSVQVHPRLETCQKLGKGQPKTESWFFAHCDKHAELYAGHKKGFTPEQLQHALLKKNIAQWLERLQPKTGDMILLESGTIHALGPGYLVLEVQQPSDTTYRVYDWDRVGLDGKPRSLHPEESLESIDFTRSGSPPIVQNEIRGPCFYMKKIMSKTKLPDLGLRVIVSALGACSLQLEQEHVKLHFGDVVVLEATEKNVQVLDEPCILISESVSE